MIDVPITCKEVADDGGSGKRVLLEVKDILVRVVVPWKSGGDKDAIIVLGSYCQNSANRFWTNE